MFMDVFNLKMRNNCIQKVLFKHMINKKMYRHREYTEIVKNENENENPTSSFECP